MLPAERSIVQRNDTSKICVHQGCTAVVHYAGIVCHETLFAISQRKGSPYTACALRYRLHVPYLNRLEILPLHCSLDLYRLKVLARRGEISIDLSPRQASTLGPRTHYFLKKKKVLTRHLVASHAEPELSRATANNS